MELKNADSARGCRFRNAQQKRASDLDPTNAWIPKLDVNDANLVFTDWWSAVNRAPVKKWFLVQTAMCADRVLSRRVS